MAPSIRRSAATVLLLFAVVAVGFVVADELSDLGAPERTTVTVLAPDGTERGTVTVQVADTYRERYTGLSDTEALGPDEGMLFVHEEAGEYAYVMRDMAFPIDIVFIGADRTITAVHHAETEEPPLTRYRGTGRWVLEVPYRWTDEHGVAVGDTVRIEGPAGERDT